ncbi:MAG: alpha/beta hydrolase [Candidatus Eremiobacteraeota bacterium]|nr:alpha/beta hydrolase [Candidatus Eremiobacteraeota bacterium]
MIANLVAEASDGIVVGARHSGANGPAIVFVHGVGSTAAAWDPQLLGLEDTYRSYAIQLRGNGGIGSNPEPDKITRNGYARDVLAIMDASKIERAHFVGCSLGGAVGFELWATAPERVASFTFVGSFAAYPNGGAYAESVVELVRAAGDMETFARARVGRLGLPPEREAAAIAEMACKTVPSYVAATRATWTGDYSELLPTITVPTLVIVGERDTVAPLGLSEEIAKGIPGARLEVVSNAGHVTNADAPERFNAMLREFLESVERH